jgi:hypothetical protein
MTTTQSTSEANRSITLPLDEILFLLNRAQDSTNLSASEQDRIESLADMVGDTDMPQAPEVYLLVKNSDGYSETVVRAFASEAEAIKIMKILNEFSSDTFEVQSVIFEP